MFAVFSYYSGKTGLTKIPVHLANGSPFKKRFFNLPMKSPGSNFDSGDRNGNLIGSAHSKDYLTAWARGFWSTSTTSPALFTLLAAGKREDLWHPGYFIGWAVVKTLCFITLLMLTDLHNSNLQGEFLKDKLDSQQSPPCRHAETSFQNRWRKWILPLSFTSCRTYEGRPMSSSTLGVISYFVSLH